MLHNTTAQKAAKCITAENSTPLRKVGARVRVDIAADVTVTECSPVQPPAQFL